MMFAPTDTSPLERLSDTFEDGTLDIRTSDILRTSQIRSLMSERRYGR